MSQDLEQQTIREYLLGVTLDEERERAIEERLLTDDDFCEQIEIAEDELIEQYLGKELGAGEREQFEHNFLSTSDRRQKLTVARSLNRFATAQLNQVPAANEKVKVIKPPVRVSFWSRRPAAVYVGLAAALVVLILGGLLWRTYSRRREIDRGLLALNEAYRQQRPGEARITGFDYAPAAATRGAGSDKFDYVARDRAEIILHGAADEQKSPEALHALGRVYLAKHEYDKAIEQFEKALASAPDDARLHSDLGAALMERGNNQSSAATEGATLTDFSAALEHFKIGRAHV